MAQSEFSSPVDDPARFNAVRAMVQHENELVNHRLTWLTTLQGLLFTALGLLMNHGVPLALGIALCVIGVGSSLSVAYTLYWSSHDLRPLNNAARELRRQLNLAPEKSKTRFGLLLDKCSFLHPWKFLPCLFGIVWLLMPAVLLIPNLRNSVNTDRSARSQESNVQGKEPRDNNQESNAATSGMSFETGSKATHRASARFVKKPHQELLP